MAKKKKVKKGNNPILVIVGLLVVIAILGSLYALFFTMPRAEAVNEYMEKQDFVVLTDAQPGDTAWTVLNFANSIDGATRRIIYTKTVNLSTTYTVYLIYLEDSSKAKAYFEKLKEQDPVDGQTFYLRGNVVIRGDEKYATSLRWRVWMF